MHKITKEEFDKKFLVIEGKWVGYTIMEGNSGTAYAPNAETRKEVISFINSHFIDSRILEEKIEEKIKGLDNTDFVSSEFILEDLKQSLNWL